MELRPTVVFDYPTAAALTAYCVKELNGKTDLITEKAVSLSGRAVIADVDGPQPMALQNFSTRFCNSEPLDNGDGFPLVVSPHGRWDADSSVASNRLGARFGRSVSVTSHR